MTVDISFPGGKKVAATFPDGLTMLTDQPVEHGGEGSAPSPFAAFVGSIGTCAGFFVQEFCLARNIPVEKLSLTQKVDFDLDEQGKRRPSAISMTINLPADFPEKYRDAVVRAANLCSVKRAILNPPELTVNFQVTT